MKRSKIKTIAAAFFTLVVLGAISCGAAERDGAEVAAERTPAAAEPLGVGERAPDFPLAAVDGRSVRFADAVAGSRGVVLWLTNLCGGCREKMPALQDIYLAYEGKVEIVAVSQLGAEAAPVREAVEEFGLTFPFLVDPEGEVSRLYGYEYVPNSCPLTNIYFVDREGVIKGLGHYPGLSREELTEKIETLVKEG